MFSGKMKPGKLRAIGIDLGTTNSAAAQSLSPAARLELEHFQRYCEDYLRLELAPLYSGHLSAERMAVEERRRLGLGDEPVRDIFALLEREVFGASAEECGVIPPSSPALNDFIVSDRYKLIKKSARDGLS